jgi:hypothetical protein
MGSMNEDSGAGAFGIEIEADQPSRTFNELRDSLDLVALKVAGF